MKELLTKRAVIIAVCIITLIKTYLASSLQLHPDEAYYWLWSRHLAFGYYDHSPMVAYFIWMTTLFSQAEVWVRLTGIAIPIVLSVLVWKLSVQLFGAVDVAAGSVLLLNLFPMNLVGSIIITPDLPAMLFWGTGVYVLWQITRTGRASLWYALGCSFGLALLSKYTAVIMIPCVFLFLVFTDERKWLTTIHPYASLLLGFAFFLPVIVWNSAHEWVSFRFQLGHGLSGQHYELSRVVEFIGGQLLVAGPFAWLCAMAACVSWIFTKDKRKLFLILSSFPIILFFAFSSLKKLAGPNWPSFAYITLSIATTRFLFERVRYGRLLWGVSLGINVLMTLVVVLHASFNFISLDRYSQDWAVADATNWFFGYRELGNEIMKKFPDAKIIMTQSHQLSAEIAYYTQNSTVTTTDKKITRVSQFDYWPLPKSLSGMNGLYIYVASDGPGPYQEYFKEVGEMTKLTVVRHGFPIRSFKIIPCVGFIPIS